MDNAPSNIHFSLVVLCYRTGKTLIPLVEKLHRMLSLLKFEWEIILVGNYKIGSDDETPRVVKELEKNLDRIRAIALPKHGMMGWDMRTGLNLAVGKYIAVIDGDGQFPLESIISCLLKIESENLDLVKTYRVRREDGYYRRFISAVFNKIFKMLFSIEVRDVNSKPKVILRSKYQLMNLKSDDWFVDTEIIIKANELKLKMGELPIHFYAISGRASFVKVGAILEFISNLYRYRFSKKNEIIQEFNKSKKIIS